MLKAWIDERLTEDEQRQFVLSMIQSVISFLLVAIILKNVLVKAGVPT